MRHTSVAQSLTLACLLALAGLVPALAQTRIEWDSPDVLLSERIPYEYHKIGPEYEKPTDPDEPDPGQNFMIEVTLADQPPRVLDRVLKRDAKLTGRIVDVPAGAEEGRVWLEDNYGRVLDEASVGVPDFEFSLDASRALHTGLHLKAEVSDADTVFWSGRQALCMVPRDEDPWRDFLLGVWHMGTEPGTGELFREMGMDHRAIQTTTSPAYNAQHDLRVHSSNILYSLLGFYHRDYKRWREMKEAFSTNRGDAVAIERHRCLSSPKEQRFIDIICTAAARVQAPYEPLHYGVGDEIGIGNMAAPHDLCGSEHCVAGFRRWLQDRYGSIDKLNAQWGTNHDSFDNVRMATVWSALKHSDDGNFSAWADRVDYMDDVLAGALEQGVRAIRQVDPDARCSATGIQPPSTWQFDIWRLTRAVDVMTPYDIGECQDIALAFYNNGKDGKIVAPGFGSDNEGLWRTFIRGLSMAQAWDGWDGRPYSKIIDIENNTLTEQGEKIRQFAEWVHSGPGRLRNRVGLHRDPVVILYSQPSIRGNWILEVTGRDDMVETREDWWHRDSWTAYQKELAFRVRQSWAMWLRDIGIWPRYADVSQVDDGYLARTGAKVLILPRAVAISDRTARAIRDFVEAGGTVIADTWPAIMDEHCHVRDRGALDDLFGVTREDYRRIDVTRVPEDGRAAVVAGTALPFVAFEKTLKATEGQAAGDYRGTPVAIANKVGSGRTLYLNFNLEEYFLHRLYPNMLESARAYLLEQLAAAGVKPTFTIRLPDREDARFHPVGHDIATYRSGRGWLVGLFMNPTLRTSGLGGIETRYEQVKDNPFLTSHSVVMSVPDGLFAYDLAAGRALGASDTIQTTSEPRTGRFYAFWPFEIQGLTVEAEAADDRVLKVSGRIRTSGPVEDEKLVVQVKVFRPDGSEQRAYRRVVDCEADRFAVAYPLGMNEHGEWKVTVREPCAGIEVSTTCLLP